MRADNWMIYGANGFTGQAIAKEAVAQGLTPTLAGRNRAAVERIAHQLALPYRSFTLEDHHRLADEFEDVQAVLLAAGPFSATSAVTVEACIQSKTHYLDITGEIDVFEACAAQGPRAREAGIALLPGVGFDVVPTDCLAATLAAQLPDADTLELAFHASGRASRGTLKTAVEGLSLGVAMRKGGAVIRSPELWAERTVRFRDRSRTCIAVPWGDVSTAYHSTGIENITVYTSVSPDALKWLRRARPLLSVAKSTLFQKLAKRLIDSRPQPVDQQGKQAQLWGRVSRGSESREATLVTPPGYALTARSAVAAVRRLIGQPNLSRGFLTPTRAFGRDFIEHFEGCDLQLCA